MEINEKLRNQIFEIIENQIKGDNPAETKLTYNRLLRQGYEPFVAKQLIGQCVSVELFDVLKFNKPFNEKRYVQNLKGLPKEPFG